MAGGSAEDTERMRKIRSLMEAVGIESSFVLDPSITRGLDYYTGIVYETFLNDLPEIGSVCSGGRYDNLAALYAKERISGVGSSIGLDRLIAALEKLGQTSGQAGFTEAVIFNTESTDMAAAQKAATLLRGIACGVYPDAKDGRAIRGPKKPSAGHHLANGRQTQKLATRERNPRLPQLRGG